MFCPKKALDDSTYNYMQVQSCLRNYPHDVVWPEVLTPYEWEHRKFPFCNTGETPGEVTHWITLHTGIHYTPMQNTELFLAANMENFSLEKV